MKPDLSGRKKHWARLTRRCNNRCVFCHDRDIQDGSVISFEEIVSDLEYGIDQKANRCVISGGEPTLHPDFFKIIRKARSLGYEWVQTITNGRMFRYADFIKKSVESGLNEITFSLHDTDPSVMDAVTGVSGSFNDAVRGLINAMSEESLIVSVDIVLSKQNAGRLEQIVRDLAGLGVREFDIIPPIPFGAAWENRDRVFFDVFEYRDDILAAIDFCENSGRTIWMSRVPAYILEGAEKYIQDPLKTHQEVVARIEMFNDYLNKGIEPDCAGERCRFCHMESFCNSISSFLNELKIDAHPALIVRNDNVSGIDEDSLPRTDEVIIDPASLYISPSLQDFISSKFQSVILIHQNPEDFSIAELQENVSHIIEINKNTAQHILDKGVPSYGGATARLMLRNYRTREETMACSVNVSEFFKEFKTQGHHVTDVINVPPCISGTDSFEAFAGVPIDVFTPDGQIDLLNYTDHFIETQMFSKSFRCSGCRKHSVCQGLHINHIRAFGFSMIPGPI